ncbi:M3 family metallopeptidase [Halosquirtibacter laminarini]|uniref:M3 family metallopeptidase n=2 Tax=Halosquirtibacter laminarini TaxID=3374600 RepID=A0AC61NQ83_9BACT|nr:M3 family metallopeptidase [Prolixibacteraceae bacterium]
MSACTEKKQSLDNPLLETWTTPYQTPPFSKIKPEHYRPAFDIAIKEAKEEVDAIINSKENPTFENTIVALSNSGERLGRILSIAYNLDSSNTSPELQGFLKDINPLLSDFNSYRSLNEDLFKRVKAVYENPGNLNDEQKKLLEDTYIGFVRSGAELDEKAKLLFAEVNKSLSENSLKFGQNDLHETNEYSMLVEDEGALDGLPQFAKDAAAEAAKEAGKEGWLFTMHGPSVGPFLKYADNRELREKLYRMYTSLAYHDNEYNNTEVIRNMVNLRLEKAKLLGYENYASFQLERRMAESPEKVMSFLNQLHEKSKPAAQKEYQEVLAFAKKSGFNGELQRWDWSYYTEKLMQEKYGFNEQDIKPYFELSKVKEGVFTLANKLYGITFKKNNTIDKYHPEVDSYEVYDKDGSLLAILYLDFFPRKSKSSGAWMTTYRDEKIENGKRVIPFVSLVTNFTKPTKDTPSLLTFREVTTFLHEFGHGLHGMFANTTYDALSGTSVYRDFVELPSQVLENWGPEKEWLDLFAVHYQTGEKIPAELVKKLIRSQNYLAGYLSERQLSFGMNDMNWHSITEPFSGDVKEMEDRAMSPMELFPSIKGSCFSTAFGHIFAGGYASGYYGYKWAEVLDADAFNVFKEEGLFNKETASRFRSTILEKGGTEHPMKLYIDFKGSEPSVDALLKRSGLL